MKYIRILSISFLASTVLGSALAAQIQVPGDYPTIQDAINAASSLVVDEIIVADGTYTGLGNTELQFFGGKAVTLRSANGPGGCTINGGGLTIFQIINGENLFGTKIQGFTLKGGKAQTGFPIFGDALGGAVRITTSSVTIVDCVFDSNTSEGMVGGTGRGGAIGIAQEIGRAHV